MRTLSFVLFMLALPLLSHAQATGDLQIFAGGGVSIPWSSNDCSKYYQVDAAFSNLVLPVIKYSGTWTPGFNFGFGIGYGLTPELTVLMDLNYNSSNLNKSRLLKDLGLTGNEYMDDVALKMVSINANLKYALPQPDLFFDPYVIGGVGYMGIAADDISVLASAYNVIGASFKTQDALNTTLGVGVDIRSGESSSLFIEVKYDVSYTKSASPFSSDNFSIVPVRIGIRGTF